MKEIAGEKEGGERNAKRKAENEDAKIFEEKERKAVQVQLQEVIGIL